MDKPTKKGKLDKTDSNQPILVNEEGKSVIVTKSIAAVWNKFDGTKTVKDIVQETPKANAINPNDLETAIDEIVSVLRKYDLLE